MEDGGLRLSVVLPAYREVARIATTVGRVRQALAGVDAEIIVVDDGSGDGTADAAAAAGADRVVAKPHNAGKGAAVRSGALVACGRTVAFTDADLSYAPEQLLGLLSQVEEGWDVVVGSRTHASTRTLVGPAIVRAVTTHGFNAVTRLALHGRRYGDTQCGLKAFSADAARLLFGLARIDGFAFDVELLHLAELHGLSVLEVPVTVSNSATSTVRVGRDSLRMLRDILRVRRWSEAGAYAAPPPEVRRAAA
ncbi:MAG TPA: glycosyltransferase [Acidimicrobiales bacterium]|nr:glycosyltransferase [Acidimicrobiales bacterium]